MTNTIEAIKASLRYDDYESSKLARASWFTVVAILADAYYYAGMTKEETICRWVVKKRKRPERATDDEFWWWWAEPKPNSKSTSGYYCVVPIEFGEIPNSKLFDHSNLVTCLNRLLFVPEKYLGRFV